MARFLLLLGAAFAILAWRLSRKQYVEAARWHRMSVRPHSSNGVPADPYVNAIVWGQW